MRVIAMALCAASIAVATSADAKRLYDKYVGDWLVGAFGDDRTGQFTHCGTIASYQSGINLLFSIGRNFRWRMGLSNSSWRLTPGATYPIVYRIDQGPPISAYAAVMNSRLVSTELTDSEALFSAFQRGHLLTVQAADETFHFSLKDSSRALAETLACTRTYMASATDNPFIARSQPQHDQTEDPGLRIEAAAVAANLLSSAGVQGFQLVDEIPPDLSRFHSIWVAPGLVGVVLIDERATLDQAVAWATAVNTSQCKGRFASAKLPTTAAGASIKTVCEQGPGKTQVGTLLFLPRQKGGVYVFDTMEISEEIAAAEKSTGAAESTAASLMEASVTVLGR